VGTEVTLTCVWYDENGNEVDRRVKTWCSRGSQQRA
jgi:hypothetical protein